MENRVSKNDLIKKNNKGLWEGRFVIKNAGYKPVIKIVYGHSYEECEKNLQQKKIENGVIDKELFSPYMLFKDWIDIWLLYTRYKRKTDTAQSYESIIQNFILPNLGNYPINKLTTGVLEHFFADMLKSGRLKRVDFYGAGLSINMVRSVHKVIYAIFHCALENSFIDNNPAKKVKIPHSHVATKKIFTKEELKKILNKAKDRGCYELFLFALCTGMERGEICALKWSDLRMKSGKIFITHMIRYLRSEYFFEPLSKPSKQRQITLSPKLLSIMKIYKRRTHSKWVFPSAYGGGLKPRNPDTLTTLFKTILRDAGIKEGTFKSLRDTCAVKYLDSGMDLRTLTSFLGFENVRTIKHSYIPYMSKKKMVAACRMEGAMLSIKTLYN